MADKSPFWWTGGQGIYDALSPQGTRYWLDKAREKLIRTDQNRIFRHYVKRNGRTRYETCLVTPFAGKDFCFNKYLRGIERLPLKNMTAIIYDNSNSDKFKKLLKKKLFPLLKDYKYIVDENQHYTVENTNEYFLIDKRTYDIYSTIVHFLPKTKYTFIVEDDIEIPEGVYERFTKLMELYPKIGTISGNVFNRRMQDPHYEWPIDWDIVERRSIPSGKIKLEAFQHREVPDFGIQQVGSTSTSCWFTRTELIKKLGIKFGKNGIRACDQYWGYRVNKAGYYVVVDRASKCKHHHKIQCIT